MPSASTSTNFTASELAHALLQANGFRASDLERNREGHLTGHQISDLLGWTLGIFVAAVLLLGLGAIVISRMNSGEEGTSAVLGLGLFALVGGLFLYNSFEKLMDALGGEVLVVEGIGAKFTRSTHSSRGSSSTTHYYKSDALPFEVSSAGYHALIEGVAYRAYYTPHTKTLVNIEPAT
jgi:hypothetical protein